MSTQTAVPADSYADARPAPRPLRRAATVAGLIGLLVALVSMVRNPAFQWDVVGRYLTADIVLDGLRTTLLLTAVALASGFALGTLLAVMRLSGSRLLRSVSWGYTWLFRSVPILVQLLFWYNISLLYPRFTIGLPFGPALVDMPTRGLINGLAAAVIGLTLHEAAHAGEIVRAGLLSVDRAQTEAAQALGLSRTRTLWRIVLPQAMRAIVPPAANQAAALLKGTSVVSVIAGQDLLFSVQLIYNRNYLVIPLLLVATLWYLFFTTLLSGVQYLLERAFARGDGRASRRLPPTGDDR
ncbi:amino acid ABC transporter permease [Actinoplanes derwentensis]|uniref:Polar amino acid transport system permease protein n=1 Tax=Actinoplanes derwentensis TaxID=113562 RepID=A0A1H2D8I4_9ACTN|nr:amino acid ABC transporter permease [Actinoplanes derwentensis]GID89715.1 putative amino acid ABC transporter, permease protein [Actinoplanes derwentensis]SDT78867.1 polar amino acid transport system permease protein [Actinoplanes derwentensis]